jgi:hypothetical protein
MTTISGYLPAVAKTISAKLPIELVERVLTRLPVSAVIELSIAEDAVLQQTGNGRGKGYLSQCILHSMGWKAVFVDRMTLVALRSLFEFISEAYHLVYGVRLCHAFVRTEKHGVKQGSFDHLRRLLSMHTRQLGPAHKELRQLLSRLTFEHLRFVHRAWMSMQSDWDTFVRHLPSSDLEDASRQNLSIPKHWNTNWIDKRNGDPEMLQKKFTFMVKAERHYRKIRGTELANLAGVLKERPTQLKKLRDPCQQPRQNMQHITDRMFQDSKRLSNLHFVTSNRNLGASLFRELRLPILPFDKWMWFFLECRAVLDAPSSIETSSTTRTVPAIPTEIQASMRIVMEGTIGIYQHSIYYTYIRSQHPRLAFGSPMDSKGTERAKASMKMPTWAEIVKETKGSESGQNSRLDAEKNVASAEMQAGVNSFSQSSKSKRPESGKLEGNAVLYEQVLAGSNRRPVFAAPSPQRIILYDPKMPHDEREIQWLEAFLRSCDYFAGLFPDIFAKIDEEARQVYPVCPVAAEREDRRKKKAEVHVAAELALRGAKYELLSRA